MRGMDFRDIEQCFLKRGWVFFLAPNITFVVVAQDNKDNMLYFILNGQLWYL